MSTRLPSGLLVSALLKRVNNAGGIGVVLAKGDAQAGGILIIVQEKGSNRRILERGLGPDGVTTLIEAGPDETTHPLEFNNYWLRRRGRDPDLWVIELDIAEAERFAAETILAD